VEQIAPKEYEVREEAPEEQDGSSFEDDSEEGALQGEASSRNSRSTIG
jgi:hypothetical protein